MPRHLSNRLTLVVALCASILFGRPAEAVDDPSLEYHTLVSEHFYVHYYDGLEHVARRTLKIAEESHEVLTPRLEWVPGQRTHVVVTDRVDSANGSARVFGRNVINIFAMPPESESVLGFYDDWLRVLVYHEYVHILHLDTIGGVAPYLNAVVGKVLVPNQTMPRWYIEGLATYYESKVLRGGRVDSSLFQTYIRTAALRDDLFDLGTATNSPVDWPMGTTPYLYGSFFLDYVIGIHGEEFAAEYNRRYGSRLIPWRINAIAKEITGKTYMEHWSEWTAYEAARANAARIAVKARGQTQVELVTTKGGRNGQAVVDPKTGEITYFRFDFRSLGAFHSYDPKSRTDRKLFEIEGAGGRGDWTPDGETFVFDRRNVHETVYSFHDLWAWDRRRDRFRRLTTGERAREPAVSPDGEHVAYIRTVPGSAELLVRRLDRSVDQKVIAGASLHPPDSDAFWQQISTPAWSPDGRLVAFSRWRLDEERRDLWVWDRETGEQRRLTDDFALEFDPFFAPDGTLLFSSDRSGIFNIYQIDLATGEVEKVTNVVRGLFDPALSADGSTLLATSYTDDGFELARLPVAGLIREPAGASEIDRLETPVRPEVETSAELQDYQPLRWLAPQFIMPDFGIVQTGAGFGLQLVGEDLVGHHSWVVSGAILTGAEVAEQSLNIGGSYTYRGGVVDVGLLGSYREYPRLREYFAGSEFVPFKEEEALGRLSLGYPLRSVDDGVVLSLFGRVEHTRFAEGRPEVDFDPADLEPLEAEQGWFNAVGFSISASNLEGYPLSISVEEGYSARASVSLEDPAIGSEFEAVTFTWNLDLFHPFPLFDRHVVAMLNSGGVTASDRRNPARFFVGGTRPQDVLSSVIFQNPTGGRQVRGHPPSAVNGRRFITSSLQYRFPIWETEQGFGTLPVFFRRIKGVAFTDAGTANDGYLVDADNFLVGVGGEILVEMVFAYYLRGNLRIGYAYGVDELGIGEGYMLYGGGF